MVHGTWFPVGSDISLPLQLKSLVFSAGADERDASAQHLVVFREDCPMGVARLWWADGAFWLGDVGVLPENRKQGFGDLLVRLLLYKALTHSASVIRLDAPIALVPFFVKYGFAATSVPRADGLVCMEILGDAVQLSHCDGSCAGCQHSIAECAPKALR